MTEVEKLLELAAEAASDPRNVECDDWGGAVVLRVKLGGATHVYVPPGGAYFVADIHGIVFADASSLWAAASASYASKGEAFARAVLDEVRGFRRLMDEVEAELAEEERPAVVVRELDAELIETAIRAACSDPGAVTDEELWEASDDERLGEVERNWLRGCAETWNSVPLARLLDSLQMGGEKP